MLVFPYISCGSIMSLQSLCVGEKKQPALATVTPVVPAKTSEALFSSGYVPFNMEELIPWNWPGVIAA